MDFRRASSHGTPPTLPITKAQRLSARDIAEARRVVPVDATILRRRARTCERAHGSRWRCSRRTPPRARGAWRRRVRARLRDDMSSASPAVRRPGLARTSLGLLPLQLVLRGGEAALPVLFAAWFGRSPETDAFVLMWSVFAVAGALLFSAFQDSALAPVYIGLRARDSVAARRLVGALLGRTLLYGGALAAAAGAIALVAARIAFGRAWPSLALPFAAALVATGVRTLHSGILNAREHYRTTPIAAAVGGVVTIGTVAALRGVLG